MAVTEDVVLLPCGGCGRILRLGGNKLRGRARCGSCGKTVIEPEIARHEHDLVDEFIIRKEIGAGSSGTVYLAHQLSLDRPVALKIGPPGTREQMDAFVAEARMAARVVHPNLVQPFKVGVWQDRWFVAMEYIDGPDLRTLVEKEGKLDWERVLEIASQITLGLATAWEELRIVHRDVKPENILIPGTGVAKLADLGLAINRDEATGVQEEIVGTPRFMSPEQFLCQPIDVRSDIYSLGVVLYYALTGNEPFDSIDVKELAWMHLYLPPPDLTEHGVPYAVAQLVQRMMAKRPEHRFEILELLAVLRRLPDEARPRPVVRGRKPPANDAAPKPVPTGRQGVAKKLSRSGRLSEMLAESEAKSPIRVNRKSLETRRERNPSFKLTSRRARDGRV